MNPDSYWPKMEEELDFRLCLLRVIRATRRNPRVDEDRLADLFEMEMEVDFREAIQFCPKMARSAAAAGMKGYLRWISNDWKSFKNPSDLCLYLAMNLLASLFAIHPDLVEGRSLTDLSRSLGVSKQRIHHRLINFNEEFGIRGRGQKSETASLSYSQAQLGNNNRVKNLVRQEEEFLGQG